MKRTCLTAFIAVLMLGVLAIGCGSDDSGNGPDNGPGNGGGTVARPTIAMNPNRAFNNAAITITLATTTADADIYYTINGPAPTAANGIMYEGPFELVSSDAATTPHLGFIRLQVIGTKEGYSNSPLVEQDFQIFPRVPIEDTAGPFSGEVFGTDDTETHEGGMVRVELSFVNGFIDAVTIEDGYSGTDPETREPNYWQSAYAHAQAFLPLMNHWDLDPAVSGASFSSAAIRKAAREAIEKITQP